jgi:hypothetical protein
MGMRKSGDFGPAGQRELYVLPTQPHQFDGSLGGLSEPGEKYSAMIGAAEILE